MFRIASINVLWIDNRDFSKAFEVAIVESQKMSEIMYFHCSDEARVMSLFTKHLMLNDKLFPFRKNVRRVWQDSEDGLQLS